jgi:hypothetical protein
MAIIKNFQNDKVFTFFLRKADHYLPQLILYPIRKPHSATTSGWGEMH